MTATTAAPTTMRSPLVARIGMIIFAVQGLGTGLWATVDPRSFFDDFPDLPRIRLTRRRQCVQETLAAGR